MHNKYNPILIKPYFTKSANRTKKINNNKGFLKAFNHSDVGERLLKLSFLALIKI